MNGSALWYRNIRHQFKLIYTLYLTVPYYKQFCEQNGLVADDRVDFLLSYHDQPDALGLARLRENDFSGLKSLYDIFKDADGVDRVRLGPNALDCDRLRTRKSLTLVPLAKQLNQERSINGTRGRT